MKKIALVEDDIMMRSLLKTLMELEGFDAKIISTISQEQIVRELEEYQPDILLMDVNLKSINGIEVTEVLRKKASFGKLGIIMASGMDLKRECMQAGANLFLLKPYMPDELINWMKAYSA